MSARQAWDLSCLDWEARLRDGRSLVPDLPLWDDQADRAVRVFNRLRLADVPGTPTMGEAGGDWFRDIVRAVFGSLDPETKQRMIRELFLLVPKKNNKTTGGALFTLTGFLLNERPRARFALMAPVNDTAEEAFNAAAGAIALDEVLDKKLHVRDHLKTIVHRESKAELEILTFDPEMLTGKKFHWTLIDELHVIAKNAKAAKALRQVRGGMLPFPEAFLAFITTMPDGQPVGVMEAELRKARDVRDGKLKAPMLPVLYELPKDMQLDGSWKNPAVWSLVNPNMGRSVTMAGLQELHDDAVSKGEAELRGWASQHINLEIGVGLTIGGWAGAEQWEGHGDKTLSVDELLERCEVIAGGVDGGGLDDLLGVNLMGREKVTGKKLTWSKAWAHPIVLERRKEVAEQLRVLEVEGSLTFVKNVGDDVDAVVAIMRRVEEAGLLYMIGVDAVGIGAILDGLVGTEEKPGPVPAEKVIAISQGWKMSGAIKTTERWLAAGELVHDDSKLMAWCVGNARVVPAGNAILITKAASGSAKIDPLMALFNSAHLMALNPPAMGGGSFWESPEAVRPAVPA